MNTKTNEKICTLCGRDCATRPRTKDRRGRYYCTSCYEDAVHAQRAATAPPAFGAHDTFQAPAGDRTLDELLPEDRPLRCAGCGAAWLPDATVCTSCGFDRHAGRVLETRVDAARPPAGDGPAGHTRWARIITQARNDSARADRWEYLRPLVLLAVAVPIVLATLPATVAMVHGAYLIGLGAEVVVGVIGLCIAAHLWMGGAGPLGLAVLRLAAVYAVVDAVGISVAPFLFVGWIVCLLVHLGLLMWLFELDAREAAMLSLLTVALKLAVGLGIALALT